MAESNGAGARQKITGRLMILTHPGLVCAVGLNAAAACAAMRAGIAGFAELPYRDNLGEPIVGAAVPGLSPDVKRDERLILLLEKALRDCLESAAFVRTDTVPLLVGLAEPGRPGGDDSMAGVSISRLQKRLARKFHPELSRCLARGHTAGFELLKAAREVLQNSDIPACLIAGVDSYLNAPSLAWLDQQGRLKTLDNPDGVIPGEAAAAVVVQRAADAKSPAAVAQVVGLGFGFEEAGILSDQPLLGLGLTAAAKAALAEAKVEMHEVDFRLSDVTGESYGFKEQALALGRLMRQRREELPLWHAADSIGDTGAAAGLIHMSMAGLAWQKRYAPGSIAACHGSAVAGERAAAILRAHPGRSWNNIKGLIER
jgi:3-oxoacyl-[acyl-carrier-protein] synthase I